MRETTGIVSRIHRGQDQRDDPVIALVSQEEDQNPKGNALGISETQLPLGRYNYSSSLTGATVSLDRENIS